MSNKKAIINRHKKFIDEVSENGVVWGLKSSDGYASLSSRNYEDENGKPIEVVCFWSNKKLAEDIQNEHWKNKEVRAIKLFRFLENWCVGTFNDNLMMGTNLDIELIGQENNPIELAYEILLHLKTKEKELNFKNHSSHQEFEKAVKDIYAQFE